MIVAIDPGSMRTGVAMFTYDEEVKKANLILLKIYEGESGAEEVVQFVAKPRGVQHTIVIEDFKHAMATGNFRNKRSAAMAKDEAITHALAKKLKGAAANAGHKLIIQEPRILSMGRKWCDLPVPKTGHIPDDKSAYIHGAHYLMESGKIRTVRDILKYGQEAIE